MFVLDQLFTSGILDDAEKEILVAPITLRMRRVELSGPSWQAPSVMEASVPTLFYFSLALLCTS
jgi:hypothetical protein